MRRGFLFLLIVIIGFGLATAVYAQLQPDPEPTPPPDTASWMELPPGHNQSYWNPICKVMMFIIHLVAK